MSQTIKPIELHVQDPWCFYLQIGRKTVEGRKGTLKKYDGWIGKEIYFYNEKRKFPVRVTDLRHYSNLHSYLVGEGIHNVLPGVSNIQEAKKIYESLPNISYSEIHIEEVGGIVAIEIELL